MTAGHSCNTDPLAGVIGKDTTRTSRAAHGGRLPGHPEAQMNGARQVG